MFQIVALGKNATVADNKTDLIAYASDLELEPGNWPLFLMVTRKPEDREGILMRRQEQLRQDDELAGYVYRSDGLNGKLTVYND